MSFSSGLLGFTLLTAAVLPLQAAPRTFEVRGVITELRPQYRIAIVRHEEIPGYMEAMSMPLKVREEKEFTPLKAGDQIQFRLSVTEDDDWIDRIKVVKAGGTAPEAESALPDLTPIAAGQPFPEAELTDDKGQPLRLSSYRGKALAVTFIYTRCPIPTFCPRLNRHFQETQKLLTEEASAPRNWQLLSVSIDPERDTPEFLAQFAAGQKADPARWRFATGTKRELTALGLKCGLRFWDDRGLIQHNMRTLVVNPDGTVREIFIESEWTPEQLAASLRAAAASSHP